MKPRPDASELPDDGPAASRKAACTRGEDKKMIAALKALWRGELPLATAFWVYVCGYGLFIELVFTALSLILYLNFEAPAAALAAHLVPLPYAFAAIVGTWRSADRYQGHPLVAWLAKAGLVAVAGVVLFL